MLMSYENKQSLVHLYKKDYIKQNMDILLTVFPFCASAQIVLM